MAGLLGVGSDVSSLFQTDVAALRARKANDDQSAQQSFMQTVQPPVQTESDADDAMARENERQAVDARKETVKLLVQTQIAMAANDEEAAFGDMAGEQAAPSAVDEFLEFASKTTEEKMRAMILQGMGVTEEEVAAMSPEDRAKIEEKIRERIQESFKEETL